MEGDTWGRWAWVAIVASLLGYAVAAVAAAVTDPPKDAFLGVMSGVAFVTLGLRR